LPSNAAQTRAGVASRAVAPGIVAQSPFFDEGHLLSRIDLFQLDQIRLSHQLDASTCRRRKCRHDSATGTVLKQRAHGVSGHPPPHAKPMTIVTTAPARFVPQDEGTCIIFA
jgi:hypothetical protein